MIYSIWRWFRTIRHFPPASLLHRVRLKVLRAFYRLPNSPEGVPDTQTLQGFIALYQTNPHLSFPRWQNTQSPHSLLETFTGVQRLYEAREGKLLNSIFPLFGTCDALQDTLSSASPLWRENYGYLTFLSPAIETLALFQNNPYSKKTKDNEPYFQPAPLENKHNNPENKLFSMKCEINLTEMIESVAIWLTTERQNDLRMLIQQQMGLFWELPPKARQWSTYGVTQRVWTYLSILPILETFDASFQRQFWQSLFQESCFITRFLERDIGGNHLIRNYKVWLAVTCLFIEIPETRALANRWWARIRCELDGVFAAQVLADGFHFERVPMYHGWVLQDLLECLSWLQCWQPAYNRQPLEALARRMHDAVTHFRHVSGQSPLYGDSSRPQTPDWDYLIGYADIILSPKATSQTRTGAINGQNFIEQVLCTTTDREKTHSTGYTAEQTEQIDEKPLVTGPSQFSPAKDINTKAFHHFEHAGIAVLRLGQPSASLIIDCGAFAPKDLPAHSHADMGSLEVHVGDCPVIVDSGVSEYEPSLLRDYFRSTAAHNSVWIPGSDQAELWGSFRVAEHPAFLGCEVTEDRWGIRLQLAYENYSLAYQHQRRLYSVDSRFWVVKDRVFQSHRANSPFYSLLHIHPDCTIQQQDSYFQITSPARTGQPGEVCLLILPFGGINATWSDQSPWQGNLNLYSNGFSLAQRGQLIAQAAPRGVASSRTLSRQESKATGEPFGWVLIPCKEGQTPECRQDGGDWEIVFQKSTEAELTETEAIPHRASRDKKAYRLSLTAEALQVGVRGPR